MNMTLDDRNNWRRSADIWHLVSSPFSPAPEDGLLMLDLAAPTFSRLAASARILVLGVTVAIVGLPWPKGSTIIAVDADETMIRNVWRPNPNVSSRVIQGDWASMPFDDGSFDLVVGDCSLNALPSASAYRQVSAEISRVLAPDGALILRCFMPSASFLKPEEVVARACTGHYPTARDFRYALTLSCADENHSVWLPDVLPVHDSLITDRDEFAKLSGFDRAGIDLSDIVFDAESQSIRLTYPPLEVLHDWIGPHLTFDARGFGSYPSAPFCPTLRFLNV